MTSVILLWHVRGEDAFSDDNNLIGVFSSVESVERAIQRLRKKPGFADFPFGFTCQEYDVDKEYTVEGYINAPNN
mgnify:CR=1 FL=1